MQEFTENRTFRLSKGDKKALMDIARNTLDLYVCGGKINSLGEQNYSAALNTHTGVFVSLHKNGKLRGCIGRLQPDKPLYELVQDITISASANDPRFKPVEEDELDEIELEISVLTPLQAVADTSEIRLGQHGIYIRKGSHSGTFLPQVAKQFGWTLEEFLGHCSRDKAHIGWKGWKEAELFIYEAIVFVEEDCKP